MRSSLAKGGNSPEILLKKVSLFSEDYTSVYMPTVTDPENSGVQQSSLQEMEEDEIGGETL